MVEGAVPTIKAATLEKLIERLTNERYFGIPSLVLILSQRQPRLIRTAYCVDSAMESFLLTLRLFATPGEVMSLLRKRFAVPLPRDRSNKELQDRYYQAKVFPVRMRVFNMAKLWLDRYNIGSPLVCWCAVLVVMMIMLASSLGCLEDEVFLKEVKELVQIMLDAGMEKVATSLQHVLQRQKEGSLPPFVSCFCFF